MTKRTIFLLSCIFCLHPAAAVVAQSEHYSVADFSTVEKIDAHAHVHSEDFEFIALAERERFRFVNMAVWSNIDPLVNAEKHRTTFLQYRHSPTRSAPVCSFPLEHWDDEDFSQQTIQYLDSMFAEGAVGVKVWKNIGMELRDASGQLVMIDDPKLTPVFKHIAARKKVLLGHLGEPKNCWLPLEEMTTNNDRSYFKRNPKYHMYLHPKMPSYEDQIAARDRMLARHPDLVFLGCHLASLEWSVGEIGKFLDRFPNACVGVAARMGQIQYQSQRDAQRVRAFFLKYQDRILYGTDVGVGPDSDAAQEFQQVRERWLNDWRYFNTNEEIKVYELDDPVRGIALPKEVVDKIYNANARKLFSGAWQPVAN